MDTQPKSKVLLIDDDTSLLVMLSDFLRFEGYDVVTADSGEEGLRRLETMTPDLIILDMSMPGMGGIGFLKAISSASGKPKHPILVLTARANMAEFFSDIDVDGFIAKPCDTEDLLMEVGRIVFLRRGNRTERLSTASPRRKVLVGEDDDALARRIARSIADQGMIADRAPSGPELLEKAIVGRPDVIVCKLVLRGMNGDAVANVLKEMPNTSEIPVILYDDSGTLSDRAVYAADGANIHTVIAGLDAMEITRAAKDAAG